MKSRQIEITMHIYFQTKQLKWELGNWGRTYAAWAASSRCSRYASRSRPKWTRKAFNSDLRMRANCFSAIARSKLTLFLGPLCEWWRKKWERVSISYRKDKCKILQLQYVSNYMYMKLILFRSERTAVFLQFWAIPHLLGM